MHHFYNPIDQLLEEGNWDD